MIINNVKADKYYKKGMVSIGEYNYGKARKYFKIALFYDYSKSFIYYQMGLIHFYALKLKDSTRYFIEYLSLSDDIDDMVYFYLGYSYYLLDNKREAKNWFKKGFTDSNSVIVRYKSLFYLRKLDVYSERYVRDILDKEGATYSDGRVRAIIFLLEGRYSDAINILFSLLESVGSGSIALEICRELSDSFVDSSNYNGFINFFYDRFEEVDNVDDKSILFNLAKSFYLASQFSDARDVLIVLLKDLPYNSGLYFNLANSYYNIKHYNLSIKYYLKTVNIDNSFYKAYYNLGVLYQNGGLLKESLSYYNKALSVNGVLFGAYYNLGILYYQSDNYLKALNSMQMSLDIDPLSEEALNNFNVISNLSQIVDNDDNGEKLLKLINISLFVLTVIIIILFSYFR